mmetsp:Transcript_102168/g.286357  ORF Transcript_102168/g.286357 Transcript_102168/m.286357 type:complete len:316 (+) Transcript_102168:140-1087(+)
MSFAYAGRFPMSAMSPPYDAYWAASKIPYSTTASGEDSEDTTPSVSPSDAADHVPPTTLTAPGANGKHSHCDLARHRQQQRQGRPFQDHLTARAHREFAALLEAEAARRRRPEPAGYADTAEQEPPGLERTSGRDAVPFMPPYAPDAGSYDYWHVKAMTSLYQEAAEQTAAAGGAGEEARLRKELEVMKQRLKQEQERSAQASEEAERLKTALRESSKFLEMQPEKVRDTIRHVMDIGWHNITWRRDYTALHLVAEHGCAEVVPLLVALGADPAMKDKKGRTAQDIAMAKEHPRVVEALEKVAALGGRSAPAPSS